MGNMFERILVVEDRASQREEIVDDLTIEGFEVIGAANSKQAVSAFREFKPHLVLMDINMGRSGEIDGVAIAGILRSTGIPFALVFLTGQGYEYGDTRHVKPDAFLRKEKVNTKDELVAELEIAWDRFLSSPVSITESKPASENGSFRIKVTHQESLDLELNGDGSYLQHRILLEPTNKLVRLADILIVKRVKGKDSKKVRILMKDGSVYHVARNLIDIIRESRMEYLIQIRGGVVINILRISDLHIDDGDYRVEIPLFDEKFRYHKLPKDDPDRISYMDLYISRTYRDKGVARRIDALLHEKG